MKQLKLNRKEKFIHNYKFYQRTHQKQNLIEDPTDNRFLFPILILCLIAVVALTFLK